MKDWVKAIKPGDTLIPKPLWNESSNKYKQLPKEVTVLDIDTDSACGSGKLVKVQYTKGGTAWLDVNWFTAKTGFFT